MPGMGVGGGVGGGAVRSTKRKLSRDDEGNGGREGSDKRNVESKKQKGRRNKSAARELGGDDRDGKKRDTADQCGEGIGEKKKRRMGPRILK